MRLFFARWFIGATRCSNSTKLRCYKATKLRGLRSYEVNYITRSIVLQNNEFLDAKMPMVLRNIEIYAATKLRDIWCYEDNPAMRRSLFYVTIRDFEIVHSEF